MEKLIKLSDSHYIIVDDFEIKEGDYDFSKNYRTITLVDKERLEMHMMPVSKGLYSKVTHTTQPIDGDGTGACFINIKQILQAEIEEAIYGYTKMAWKLFGGSFEARGVDSEEEADRTVNFGIECIKAQQELSKDKLFTVEDLKFALTMAQKTVITDLRSEERVLEFTVEEIIKSVLPKSEWDVEFIDNKIVLKNGDNINN